MRIAEFDVWVPGYANASVSVFLAGTSTLATLYTDAALTTVYSGTNPVTLDSREVNGVYYGKFPVSLYVASAYHLDIDSTDQTGTVQVPILTLVGADASDATVTRTGGSVAQALDDILARFAFVEDFGEFLPISDSGASSNTNQTTLNAAMGAVSGGGYVIIPADTFEVLQSSIPANVVIVGQGKDVSFLRSEVADDVFTLAGNGAGLMDITIDGVTTQVGSNGIRMKNKDFTRLERLMVKRFATGIYAQGGAHNRWEEVDVSTNTIGAKLHGDLDSGNGAIFRDNFWSGRVLLNVTTGVDLSYVDAAVENNHLALRFEDNAATAFYTRGAKYTDMRGSTWFGNITNVDLDDFDSDNPVVGLWVENFRMTDGAMALQGWCEDISFRKGSISDVDITLTLPQHNILAIDVIEDALVTLSGDGEKWLRWKSNDDGASSGVTTDNAATKAWGMYLEPGQRVFLVGTVIGNARTSDESAEYYFCVGARRPPSTLDYENQTVNFTLGATLTGLISGATGTIVTDTDAGATGTLELRDIVGAFQDGEVITDGVGGSAEANGTLVAVDVELLGTVTDLRTPREDDANWAATFVANNPEIELQVTGATGKTIDWICNVKKVAT